MFSTVRRSYKVSAVIFKERKLITKLVTGSQKHQNPLSLYWLKVNMRDDLKNGYLLIEIYWNEKGKFLGMENLCNDWFVDGSVTMKV